MTKLKETAHKAIGSRTVTVRREGMRDGGDWARQQPKVFTLQAARVAATTAFKARDAGFEDLYPYCLAFINAAFAHRNADVQALES